MWKGFKALHARKDVTKAGDSGARTEFPATRT